METKKYNIWKGAFKALISLVIVGVPIIMQLTPAHILDLTVSGILLILLNWAKFYYKKA